MKAVSVGRHYAIQLGPKLRSGLVRLNGYAGSIRTDLARQPEPLPVGVAGARSAGDPACAVASASAPCGAASGGDSLSRFGCSCADPAVGLVALPAAPSGRDQQLWVRYELSFCSVNHTSSTPRDPSSQCGSGTPSSIEQRRPGRQRMWTGNQRRTAAVAGEQAQPAETRDVDSTSRRRLLPGWRDCRTDRRPAGRGKVHRTGTRRRCLRCVVRRGSWQRHPDMMQLDGRSTAGLQEV